MVHPLALIVGAFVFCAVIFAALWWDVSTYLKEKSNGT